MQDAYGETSADCESLICPVLSVCLKISMHVFLFSLPQNICNNHMLDVNVRWLAVLYFKNGIERYWRRTAPQ